MSIRLEPHNVEAYKQVKKIHEKENRAVVIHPTGTGKSYIGLKLIEDNEGKKVIYLAPSKSILHQIKDDMIKNGIKFNNGNQKTVERYTYQKLTRLLKSGQLNIDVDIIILDEFHHCGAPEWELAVQELLAQNPNAKVLGLSATPMRYFDDSIRDMAEELFGKNIASEMTFAEAIEQGILPKPIYTTGIYDASEIKREYEEKVRNCPDGKEKEQARKALRELSQALDASVEGLPELLEKAMTNKNGKYVVYCKDIKDMQEKMAEAQKMFGKVNPNIELYSVSSQKYDSNGDIVEVTDTQNKRQIRNFERNSDNEKLKLLFSVNMINEGYHYKDLDGVIMMRPTNSPTLFAQQLGRALSVGGKKQPIVIDLVNNADSIKIIEDFYKHQGTSIQNSRKSMLSGLSVSDSTRNVSEIIKRLDSLVKQRSYLTNEEKLDLMVEYLKSIEGTDETFTFDSVYKGYNIGHMRNTLRTSYWNGTLKISDELLEKFIENGIIVEKATRIRTTVQDKYEFLTSMIGKDAEEIRQAKMESGLTYGKARAYLQHLYNTGRLDLTPEQIEYLKQNNILNLSQKEKENIKEQYEIPKKHITKIVKEYGSFEDFLDKYKRGECDYDFSIKYKGDVFVGARAIVVSEKDMTVKQKLLYTSLCNAILGEKIGLGSYINVDEIPKILSELNEDDQKIIRARFMPEDGQYRNLEYVGKEYFGRNFK